MAGILGRSSLGVTLRANGISGAGLEFCSGQPRDCLCVMRPDAMPLLTDLLKQVSRSFYLTLRVLPGAVRPQIGLAYLLARTTDTIADTEIIPLEKRLTALGMLRSRIFGQTDARLDFGELAQQQGLHAERVLLERVEDSLALLRTLSPEDLELVRKVIDTITSGQELDLMRFGKSVIGSDTTDDG